MIGEIRPVDCKSTDGIWDIVLRLLRAQFQAFLHRCLLWQDTASRLRIARRRAQWRDNGH